MASRLPSRSAPGASNPSGAPGAWEAAAALAAVVLYARTLGFGWVYDDQMEVVLNTFVTSLAHVPRMFSTTVWAGSGMETFLYRPLALVTYALNHLVSGTDPWSYHLVNVLLHAGAAALVVRVGRLWGLSVPAAGAAGVLFALHPIHVEAVAPVFGRKDLLATLLVLAMAVTHRGALARGGWRQAVAPLLYLAAMLSKEVGVVGVALVVAQDLHLERDRRAFLGERRVPLLYASYLLAAALYLAARTAATGGLGIPDTSFFDNPLVGAPPGVRILTAWTVVAKGLGLLFLPLAQSPDYSFDAISLVVTPADPRFLAALIGTALAGGLLTSDRVRRSVYPLALGWYLLALLPVANLLVLTGTIFAERLLYLPSAAFSLAVGGGLGWAAARRPAGTWGAAAVAGLVLAFGSWRYASVWTDDVALFRHAATTEPRSTKAHHKLGEELLRRGELEGALGSLNRALEIAPENVWAAETLATARSHVAARYLEEARAGRWPEGAEVVYALGAVALERGDTALAVTAVERSLAVDPELARGWFTLAALRVASGDTAAVVAALQRFLETAAGRYPQQADDARAFLRERGVPLP